MKKSYPDECLERAGKAAEGPWKIDWTVKTGFWVGYTNGFDSETIVNIAKVCDVPHAEFIAHARQDVPILALRLIEACHYLRNVGLGHLADALEKEPTDGR